MYFVQRRLFLEEIYLVSPTKDSNEKDDFRTVFGFKNDLRSIFSDKRKKLKNNNNSGALEHEARQRSTIGKKMK